MLLSITVNNKKCASKFVFFNEKNWERFGWFLTEKIDFESPFFALCDKLAKLGKASQDAYNPGKWLIL